MQNIILSVFCLIILLTLYLPFFALSEYRKEKRLFESCIPCDGKSIPFITFQKYVYHHFFRNPNFLYYFYERSFLDPIVRVIFLCLTAIMVYGNLYFISPRNQIGSIFEEKNYSAQYVIEISRNRTTFYKLPGDIHREYEVSTRKYFLDKVHWPNGGWLYFGDDVLVSPEKEYELEAQNGETFYVTLTKESLSEKNQLKVTGLNIVVMIISIYPIYQFLFTFFILSKKQK